jgi:nitroreductase
VAAGYAGEKLILHLCGMGLGTVWIGGTMDREAFTKASALSEDEMMVCITPVGVPAAKMSLRQFLKQLPRLLKQKILDSMQRQQTSLMLTLRMKLMR